MINYTIANISISSSSSFYGRYEIIIGFFIYLFMLFISLVTIIGNLIVILCFLKFKHIRTINNYYILSLSVADTIIGILCMPFYAHTSHYNGDWRFGMLYCRVWLVLDYVAGTASVLQIVVISFDRFISVVYPIKYRLWSTKRFICLNITLVWLIAFLNYGPAIIFWPILASYLNENATYLTSSNDLHYECRAEFRNNFYYLMTATFIEFFLPFISITTFNFSIYWNIRRRMHKRLPLFEKKNILKKLSELTAVHESDDKNGELNVFFYKKFIFV